MEKYNLEKILLMQSLYVGISSYFQRNAVDRRFVTYHVAYLYINTILIKIIDRRVKLLCYIVRILHILSCCRVLPYKLFLSILVGTLSENETNLGHFLITKRSINTK